MRVLNKKPGLSAAIDYIKPDVICSIVAYSDKARLQNSEFFRLNTLRLHWHSLRKHHSEEILDRKRSPASDFHLTQIRETTTKDSNIIDIVFTNNPTQSKRSTTLSGISDHCMIVTDVDTKPHTANYVSRKICKFVEHWESIIEVLSTLSDTLCNDWGFIGFRTTLRDIIDRIHKVPAKTV